MQFPSENVKSQFRGIFSLDQPNDHQNDQSWLRSLIRLKRTTPAGEFPTGAAFPSQFLPRNLGALRSLVKLIHLAMPQSSCFTA